MTKEKLAKKNEISVCSEEWYLINRELYTNEDGRRYYDLPLQAVMEIVHMIEQKIDGKHTWDVELMPSIPGWVNVKVSMKIFDGCLGSMIGSAMDNQEPVKGDISPIVSAQSQALKSFFKKLYPECNLPKELSIVEEEQSVVSKLEEIELPESNVVTEKEEKVKPARKKVTSKKLEEVKEEGDNGLDEEVTIKEKTDLTESIESSETDALNKDVISANDPYEYIVSVGNKSYDGLTLREVASTPDGAVFLKYYADRVNTPRFAKFKDLCEAAAAIVNAENIEADKAKH